MKFKNFRLSTKQFIGFGVILLIFLAVHFYSTNRMSILNDAIADFNENWLPRAIAITNINQLATELRLTQLKFASVSGQTLREEQTKNMIAIIDQINNNLDTYAQIKEKFSTSASYLEEEKQLFESFDQEWENYQELSFQFFWYVSENKSAEAIALLTNEASVVYQKFKADLTSLVDLYERAVLESTNYSALTFKATRGFTTLLLLVAIGFSIFFAVVLVRLIVIPVHQLEKAAKKVSEGDLTAQSIYDSNDEIGSLSRSFNRMTASLLVSREEREMQSSRLKMQWDVLRETNEELERKSEDLEKQKNLIEKKNKDLQKALTKLKSTQNQLVQSEKMASIGQLTAGIAHEINNPINFVTSNISPLRKDIDDLLEIVRTYDQIMEKCDLPAETQQMQQLKKEMDYQFILIEIGDLLNGIEEGAVRTKEIVRGLRNFSRLDEDDMKLADINEGIDSTLMMLRNQLKDRIEIVREFGPIPQIQCYPGKLNQVFMNIISNAGQAIENTGTIIIKSALQGKYVKISIRDNGRGIPKEMQKRIFEPFFTTKAVGAGTGLGLSISYSIIKDHDGDIKVKSDPKKGTEFTITIPAKH